MNTYRVNGSSPNESLFLGMYPTENTDFSSLKEEFQEAKDKSCKTYETINFTIIHNRSVSVIKCHSKDIEPGYSAIFGALFKEHHSCHALKISGPSESLLMERLDKPKEQCFAKFNIKKFNFLHEFPLCAGIDIEISIESHSNSSYIDDLLYLFSSPRREHMDCWEGGDLRVHARTRAVNCPEYRRYLEDPIKYKSDLLLKRIVLIVSVAHRHINRIG